MNSGVERCIALLSTIILEMTDPKVYHAQSSMNDTQFRIICYYLFPGLSSYLKHYPESEMMSQAYAKMAQSKNVVLGNVNVLWRKSCHIIVMAVAKSTKFSSLFITYLTNTTADIISKSMSYEITNGLHLLDMDDGDDSYGDTSDTKDTVYFDTLHMLCQLASYQKLIFDAKAISSILGSNRNMDCLVNAFVTMKQFGVDTAGLIEVLVSSIMKIVYQQIYTFAPAVASVLVTHEKATLEDISVVLAHAPSFIKILVLKGFILQSVLEQITKQLLIWLTFIPAVSDRNKASGDTNTNKVKSTRSVSVTTANEASAEIAATVKLCHELLIQCAHNEPQVFDLAAESVQTQLSCDLVFQDSVSAGKRQSLDSVLEVVFVSAAHRQPFDNGGSGSDPSGVSLFLSLSSESVQTRLSAIRRYDCTIADPGSAADSALTADLEGLAEAMCRQLSDAQADVALAVWKPSIVRKIATHVKFNCFYEALVDSISFWLRQSSNDAGSCRENKALGRKVLSHILLCLCEESVLLVFKSITHGSMDTDATSNESSRSGIDAKKVRARHWILAIVVFISSEFESESSDSNVIEIMSSVAASNSKKTKKSKTPEVVNDSQSITGNINAVLKTFVLMYTQVLHSTANIDIVSHPDTSHENFVIHYLSSFLVSTLLSTASSTAEGLSSSAESLQLLQSLCKMAHSALINDVSGTKEVNLEVRCIPSLISLLDGVFIELYRVYASHVVSTDSSPSTELRNVETTVHLLLSLYFPIMIRMLVSRVAASSSSSSERQALAVASMSRVLRLCIARPTLYHSRGDSPTCALRFLDIHHTILSPVYSNDLAMRVLVALLEAEIKLSSENILPLIKLCVEAFFSVTNSQMVLALLQIITTPADSGSNVDIAVAIDDDRPFISRELLSTCNQSGLNISGTELRSVLLISNAARAGALEYFRGWFAAAFEGADGKDNPWTEYQNVVTSLPVVIVACCTDIDVSVRMASLKLCLQLKHVLSNFPASSSVKSTKGKSVEMAMSQLPIPGIPGMSDKIKALLVDKNQVVDHHVNVAVLKHVVEVITNGSDIIQADPLSAHAYFASSFFCCSSDVDALGLQQYLLHFSTYFASTHDANATQDSPYNFAHNKHTYMHHIHSNHVPSNNYYISAAVFRTTLSTSATMSLSRSWPYMYAILSDTTANIIDGSMHSAGAATVSFYSLLEQSLVRVDSLESERKDIMVESICDHVVNTLSLPVHETSSQHQLPLLLVIQREVEYVLTPQWLSQLETDTKHALYTELLELYYKSTTQWANDSEAAQSPGLILHRNHHQIRINKILERFEGLSSVVLGELMTKYTEQIVARRSEIQRKYEQDSRSIVKKYSAQHKRRSDSITSQTGVDMQAEEVDEEDWMLEEETDSSTVEQTYLLNMSLLSQAVGHLVETLMQTYRECVSVISPEYLELMRSLLRDTLRLMELFNQSKFIGKRGIVASNKPTETQLQESSETQYDFDYARGLLSTLACFALTSADGKDVLQHVDSRNSSGASIVKTAKKKSKESVVASANENRLKVMFTQEEIDRNIEMLLSVLHLCETVQSQTALLILLRHYIVCYPPCTHSVLTSLGSLVAQSALLVTTGEESSGKILLVKDILHTCSITASAVSSVQEEGVSNNHTSLQRMLQSLFMHCGDMSTATRGMLVTVAAETLGVAAVPAIITVLLAHVYTAYVPEDAYFQSKLNSSKKSNIQNKAVDNNAAFAEDVTLLLSVSSQRKARKMLMSSLPEEIYQLIIHLTEQLPVVLQTYTMVVLLQHTHYLMQVATQEFMQACRGAPVEEGDAAEESQSPNSDFLVTSVSELNLHKAALHKELPVSSSVVDSYGVMSVDGDEITAYALMLKSHNLSSDDSNATSGATGESAAATLALLHLQYIADIFEHRLRKQQPNISVAGGSIDQQERIQTSYLEFSDEMLQLYAFASHIQSSYDTYRSNRKSLHESMSTKSWMTVPKNVDKLTNQVVYTQVSTGALGQAFASTCLEILKYLQNLFDIPTFIAIFQELMVHPEALVRAKAFEMLGNKLEEMNMNLNKKVLHENALFIDLLDHLRGYLANLLLDPASIMSFRNSGDSKLFVSNFDMDSSIVLTAHQRLSLTQTAVQCVDTLTRHFTRLLVKLKTSHETTRKEWEAAFSHTLSETVAAAQVLANLVSPSAPGSSVHSTSAIKATTAVLRLEKSIVKYHKRSDGGEASAEILKTLGSLYLLSGTLCAALGNKTLPQLSTIVAELLTTFRVQSNRFSATNEAQSSVVTLRASISLMRNILSAVKDVAFEVSSFLHPYLNEILLTILPIHAHVNSTQAVSVDSAMAGLLDDVNRLLPAIVLKVSPRLALPLLLSVAVTMTGEGHVVAYQYTELLTAVFKHVERNHVVAHMSDLCSLVVLLLDYRRVYQDGSSECAKTENAIINMSIELCIKFTETELRAFLTRLAEWRDVDMVDDDMGDRDHHPAATASLSNNSLIKNKRPLLLVTTTSAFNVEKYARSITVYHFLSLLGDKLKSIFTPLMALFWDDVALVVDNYAKQVQDIHEFLLSIMSNSGDSQSRETSQKKKKQKKSKRSSDIGDSSVVDSEPALAAKNMLTHLNEQMTYLLTSLALACEHDSDGFVDEQIFEEMMSHLSPLVNLREAFQNDEAFLEFSDKHLSRACVSLTQASMGSSRDILWKPLNHKILLSCRDVRAVVRLSAVSMLFKMFHDVGEDYLGLLPECLPFLSELMEDDNEDVCRRTHETVRLIEDMSGEKLETYLS